MWSVDVDVFICGQSLTEPPFDPLPLTWPGSTPIPSYVLQMWEVTAAITYMV